MNIPTKKPQQSIAASPSSEVFVPKAHQWVQLRNSLSEYSEDTALLLCPGVQDRWIAWIPGFGQATLERSQLLKAID